MAEEADAPERLEGPGLSCDEGPEGGFAFGARAELGGETTEAWSASAKSTLHGETGPSGDDEGVGSRTSGPPEAPCTVPVRSSASVDGDAPAYVRQAGARWRELRCTRGEAAEVTREALDSLERIEGMIERLALSFDDDESAYRVRLAEGLARSLRDVLTEFGDEADRVTRGAWQLLLLG
jgi:hypothetical protein